jgi:glycolate oxidase
LQIVTADGRLVDLGGKVMKSSTGFHLMDLMIGSEGTLGVITEVTLSLIPPPGASMTLVVPYESAIKAIESVPPMLNAGIVPMAVEFVEKYILSFAEVLVNKSWPSKQGNASLLIIVDGQDEDALMLTAERISEILKKHDALDILVAENKEQQADILSIRSMIYEALKPGTAELFDICVPRSEIAGHVGFIKELEQRTGVGLPTYGHAGDGNTHTHALRRSIEGGVFGDELPGWRKNLENARRELYSDAISRGGVISGEHGVGLVKRPFIRENLGDDVVDLMIAVKKALDPEGILNPGKVLP